MRTCYKHADTHVRTSPSIFDIMPRRLRFLTTSTRALACGTGRLAARGQSASTVKLRLRWAPSVYRYVLLSLFRLYIYDIACNIHFNEIAAVSCNLNWLGATCVLPHSRYMSPLTGRRSGIGPHHVPPW